MSSPNALNGQHTETSPLLVNADEDAPIANEDNDDGGDLERQTSNDVKFQGLPEVKKRMKYIFPAIAIGVSTPMSRNLPHTTSRHMCAGLASA
jgi:hypothetical protein